MTTSAPWVTFRPEIKVLDCTVRDGGLINSHRFEDKFVKAVYDTCIESGIDYMELGYKASKKLFSRDEFGDWLDENLDAFEIQLSCFSSARSLQNVKSNR